MRQSKSKLISPFFNLLFMINDKITGFTRIMLFICGLALVLVLFTPLWRIDLMAPQYPEGLTLLIYANRLLLMDLTIISG